MTRVVAVNGSPMKESGNTAKLLESFLGGMEDSGASTKVLYASAIRPKPCTGEMNCWYKSPGECHIRDGMQQVYPEVKGADILVLATPVYVPLPGDMQNFINRLVPFVEPDLSYASGRTRARLRADVRLRRLALLSTGAWWELDNFGTVMRIAEEFSKDVGVEFAGAVLRPHAFLLERDRAKAEVIFQATRKAGQQLISEGRMSKELLDLISQPLISEEELRGMWNQLNRKAMGEPKGH